MDVLLGEAVAGSRSVRFEDMLNIASTISNRAAATGVSMQQVVSAPNQYAAYGKSLPPGVEKYRGLAQKALEHVQTKGPVTTATYYATPSATKNLPSGLPSRRRRGMSTSMTRITGESEPQSACASRDRLPMTSCRRRRPPAVTSLEQSSERRLRSVPSRIRCSVLPRHRLAPVFSMMSSGLAPGRRPRRQAPALRSAR